MMKKKYHLLIAGLLILLLVSVVLSISLGSKSISFQTIVEALISSKDSLEMAIIRERLPRTIFGILSGASLAVAGCLMQSITRNPVADPSILGVNSGASLLVVCGIAFFNIQSAFQYIILGFIGAILAALFVYGIASSGYGEITPMKLVLAGMATTIALSSIVSAIVLPNSQVMDTFRFWQVGSIGGVQLDSIIALLPCFIIGLVIALLLAGHLTTLALGDELATGLGINVVKVRAIGAIAGVLLCGATTALAGPIGFIGLMVPHFMRLVCGENLKLLLPCSALGGSVLLVICDVIGRVVLSPSELEVGIITALIGAPIFILVVKKARVKGL